MSARSWGLLCCLMWLMSCGREFELVGLSTGSPHPLNGTVIFEFSEAVDPRSIHEGTLRIRSGADGMVAEGRFEVAGRQVRFHPRSPLQSDLSDAGLRPGSAYQVELVGLPRVASIRSVSGRRLTRGAQASVVTASLGSETAPNRKLFQDLWPGEPRLATPGPVQLRLPDRHVDLIFTEPLDPRSVAAADLRLRRPGSTDADRESNPRLRAELVENQDRARVRLFLPAQLGAPLVAGEGAFEIDVAPDALRDFGGNRFRDGPRINMEIVAAGD